MGCELIVATFLFLFLGFEVMPILVAIARYRAFANHGTTETNRPACFVFLQETTGAR